MSRLHWFEVGAPTRYIRQRKTLFGALISSDSKLATKRQKTVLKTNGKKK